MLIIRQLWHDEVIVGVEPFAISIAGASMLRPLFLGFLIVPRAMRKYKVRSIVSPVQRKRSGTAPTIAMVSNT